MLFHGDRYRITRDRMAGTIELAIVNAICT
jgi:hypothetical protein